MELSIDTSTRQASIGLSEGGNILAKTSINHLVMSTKSTITMPEISETP